jgi:hypothetical protein
MAQSKNLLESINKRTERLSCMEAKVDKLSDDLSAVRTKVELVVTSIGLVQQEQVQITELLKCSAAGSTTPAADHVMGAAPSGWASNTSAAAHPLVFDVGPAVDQEPIHEQEELDLGPRGLLTAHNLDLGPFLLKQACGAMISGEVNTDARALAFVERTEHALEDRNKGTELQLARASTSSLPPAAEENTTTTPSPSSTSSVSRPNPAPNNPIPVTTTLVTILRIRRLGP